MVQPNYATAPNGSGEAFKRYIEAGIPLGGFLMAVVENDLKEACGRADLCNQLLLFNYVHWLYNNAPSICWGSPEKVRAWLAERQAILNKTTEETNG